MLPLIYGELRRLAQAYLRRERSDHTLQPTALVHEAYLRLAAQHNLDWENRVQVMALAASMMRRVLLDYAAARTAAKRPDSGMRIPFSESLAEGSEPMSPVLVGVAVGFGVCATAARLMSVMLYGVSPMDPLTFAGVALFLTLVALLACYVPARRATRVDPADALRYE